MQAGDRRYCDKYRDDRHLSTLHAIHFAFSSGQTHVYHIHLMMDAAVLTQLYDFVVKVNIELTTGYLNCMLTWWLTVRYLVSSKAKWQDKSCLFKRAFLFSR